MTDLLHFNDEAMKGKFLLSKNDIKKLALGQLLA